MNHGIIALQERLARATRDNAPAGQNVDLVCRGVCVSNLVREDHDSEVVFFLHCVERLVEFVSGGRVEAKRRLVQKHQSRLERQCPRECDAPLPCSSELNRHRVVVDLDADLGKQLPRRVASVRT